MAETLDPVSDETIAKMHFLTGNITGLRSCHFTMLADDSLVRVMFDADGKTSLLKVDVEKAFESCGVEVIQNAEKT